MDDINERIEKQLKDMSEDEKEAAKAIAMLKYDKLDHETENKVQALFFLVETIDKPIKKPPKSGYSIDGIELPKYPPMPYLREFIGKISDPFEKQITPSDVDDTQSRFAFRKKFVETNYLSMLNSEENVENGIPVIVYGPNGGEYEMVFKYWSQKIYIINNGWKLFCNNYKLRAYTYWATVWMFRHKQTGRLCFALSWKNVPSTTELFSTRGKKRRLGEDGEMDE